MSAHSRVDIGASTRQPLWGKFKNPAIAVPGVYPFNKLCADFPCLQQDPHTYSLSENPKMKPDYPKLPLGERRPNMR